MDGELMRFALLALSLLLTAPAYAQRSTPADCYDDSTSTVTTPRSSTRAIGGETVKNFALALALVTWLAAACALSATIDPGTCSTGD
jgi:hypothetical protein